MEGPSYLCRRMIADVELIALSRNLNFLRRPFPCFLHFLSIQLLTNEIFLRVYPFFIRYRASSQQINWREDTARTYTPDHYYDILVELLSNKIISIKLLQHDRKQNYFH